MLTRRSLSVFSTEFSGHANLNKGVNGRIVGQASFTGGIGRPKWDLNLKGPLTDVFTLKGDPLLIAKSTCGLHSATLNIDFTMFITPPAPTANGAISGTIGVSSASLRVGETGGNSLT